MYDYDAWKTGWYDIGEPACLCKNCEEKEQTIDESSNHLTEVVKQLYSADLLDSARLEKALDELCHLLHVNIHPGTLQVERKGNKAQIRNEATFEAWKSFAIAYTQSA